MARVEYTGESDGSMDDRSVPTVRNRIDDLANYTGYQAEVIDKLTQMLSDILTPETPVTTVPDEKCDGTITTSDVEQRLSIIATRVDRNTNRLNILMKRINL